jgi:hypothetical protein
MTWNPKRVDDLLELQKIWERLGPRVQRMEGWRDRGRGTDNTFEVLGCHHTGDTFDVDRVLRDGQAEVSQPRRRYPRPCRAGGRPQPASPGWNRGLR